MIKTINLFFVSILLIGISSKAQEADTTYYLENVEITANFTDTTIFKVPKSVSVLDHKILQESRSGSLYQSFNKVPGVKFDTRGWAGSSRISIRGSLIRSPFGVRNIKMYYEDIPLTSPDGTTPFEILEPGMFDGVEILKNLSGSLYGTGTGGAIIFKNNPQNFIDAGLDYEVYENGNHQRRTFVNFTLDTGKNTFNLRYFNHHNLGYRDQEFAYRNQVLLKSKLNYKDGYVRLYGFYTDAEWGLPGALTREEFEEDPTQAVQFSKEVNASVDKRRFRIGATNNYQLTGYLSNITSLVLNTESEESPTGTSPFFRPYNFEDNQGFGFRTRFVYSHDPFPGKLILGYEVLTEQSNLREFNNVMGNPVGLQKSSITNTTNQFIFLKSVFNLPFQFLLEAEGSLNYYHYDYSDLYELDSLNLSRNLFFQPQPLFGISLLKRIAGSTLYLSFGQGFSPPSLEEIFNSGGALNFNLEAEKANSIELGYRFGKNKWYFDITAYYQELKNAITREQITGEQFQYNNSGLITFKGLEWLASYNFKLASIILEPNFSGTYTRYTYVDFIQEDADYSGNQVPGISPVNANFWINAMIDRLTIVPEVFYRSDMFFNDENTVQGNEYLLVNIYMEYQYLLKYGSLKGRLGVRNITNEVFSSFIQANAVRDKFYNPAPGRSFFVGLSYYF